MHKKWHFVKVQIGGGLPLNVFMVYYLIIRLHKLNSWEKKRNALLLPHLQNIISVLANIRELNWSIPPDLFYRIYLTFIEQNLEIPHHKSIKPINSCSSIQVHHLKITVLGTRH